MTEEEQKQYWKACDEAFYNDYDTKLNDVWHPIKELPTEPFVPLLIYNRLNDCVWMTIGYHDDTLPTATHWAYLWDLLPDHMQGAFKSQYENE